MINISLFVPALIFAHLLQASNELAIASSSVLMRHSVALLLASLHFNAASESSNLVFDILTNIGSKVMHDTFPFDIM